MSIYVYTQKDTYTCLAIALNNIPAPPLPSEERAAAVADAILRTMKDLGDNPWHPMAAYWKCMILYGAPLKGQLGVDRRQG